MNKRIRWPNDKDFAFTVFDDTDSANVENTREVYALLKDYGFQTTKSVWTLNGDKNSINNGLTCDDKNYLDWILSIQKSGFEIGFHNATYSSSKREQTITGIEQFYRLFGYYPMTMANHNTNKDSIYWGNNRLSGINKFIYTMLNRKNFAFSGEIKESDYFWGDICNEKIKYVRNFVFPQINTLSACPFMPYYDPDKPYVNHWFASSEGSDVHAFNKCISERNQDLLEKDGGACIMYTHFALGFYDNNKINKNFRILMNRLRKKNGWFVPVSTLLDYLLEKNGQHFITNQERKQLERKWLLHKLRVGTT